MTIPVGAKIIIHHTRGGIVCLPITPEAGTGVVTVDVPTIISAVVDSTDHNYWFLTWKAGANNTKVSVNIQTGAYPPNHGVVTGSGSTTAMYAATIGSIKVRFSGPSTTYYIKLWGERNGVYSATGAQATITSPADVVPPGDEPEPPIVIGVIDTYLCAGLMGNSQPSGQQTFSVFSGTLPFTYDGTTNIYIGGPVQDTAMVAFNPNWQAQPTPRYMEVDNIMTITGPNGSIDVGSLVGSGWYAPVNIRSLLNPGTNTLTISLLDQGAVAGVYGVSDLYVRSYYL